MPRVSDYTFQPTVTLPPWFAFVICITRFCLRTPLVLLLLQKPASSLSLPSLSSFEYLSLSLLLFAIICQGKHLDKLLNRNLRLCRHILPTMTSNIPWRSIRFETSGDNSLNCAVCSTYVRCYVRLINVDDTTNNTICHPLWRRWL